MIFELSDHLLWVVFLAVYKRRETMSTQEEKELLDKAWELFIAESENPRGSYHRAIWDIRKLGEHLYQYNTGYEYKDGTLEGNKCNIVWFEKGKLTQLKKQSLRSGYDVGPNGNLYTDLGNNIYSASVPEYQQLSYRTYEPYTRETGIFARITSKGIEPIKQDLTNLSEEDFLRLYVELANNREYKDALKERTFDFSGKWGDSIKLLPQRLAKQREIVDNDIYSFYRNLRLSREDKSRLIELINKSFGESTFDESHLEDFKGKFLQDIKISEQKAELAAEAYGFSDFSGLLQVAVEAPETPALELIANKYREHYKPELVNGIIDRADEIVKLPYKQMFFKQLNGDSANVPEANFLDEFTNRIRDLAMNKYGQEDWYTSISEAAKNPEFMKDSDEVWNKMFKDVNKYATYKPNDNNNDYIRQLFPKKVIQLHKYVTQQKANNFYQVLDETIKYYQQVGKMERTIQEYNKDNETHLHGNLHFDLVNAGIESKRDAKRCLDIWVASNERPDAYGSPYNEYSIKEIATISKSKVMQDWMYPVMMNAIEKGGLTLSEERMPSERTLFDCCKAWKINPSMPQRLAKFVGTHSLRGRMLAGSIFAMMSKEGNITEQEWRENKNLHEKFYEELSQAEKMPIKKAFQQYIPNSLINRKRLVGMSMEEKSIENTPENFKKLYMLLRDEGMFDTMLAKPTKTKTVLSSRLLAEMAKREFDKNK